MWDLMSPETWGLLAGLTGLAGYVPYLRDAWRRTSDPDPAAWLIWTMEYSVLLAAQVALNAPWPALWLAALQLAGTTAVFAMLAARGGWRFSAGRWTMLGCAAAIMAAWPFAHAPGPAICLALTAEGAGMMLVIVGAYRHPASETLLTWEAFTVAGLLDLPALGRHAPRLLYAYPAFFVVMGAAVLLAAALGARAQAAQAARASAQRQRYLPWNRKPSRRPLRAAPPPLLAAPPPLLAAPPRLRAAPPPVLAAPPPRAAERATEHLPPIHQLRPGQHAARAKLGASPEHVVPRRQVAGVVGGCDK
jgi:hypothetical protein